MRQLLILAAGAALLTAQASSSSVFKNARVVVTRTTGTSSAVSSRPQGPGVVVRVPDGAARWADDVARAFVAPDAEGTLVAVQLKDGPAAPAPPAATQPGDGTFTGMSFKTLFENDKVRAIRARMEVGAREAFHTHASDTVVVHLSGGDIEDTADGKTVVNHWEPGDVEFEARGSSHSARNVGKAVDVVLVALK